MTAVFMKEEIRTHTEKDIRYVYTHQGQACESTCRRQPGERQGENLWKRPNFLLPNPRQSFKSPNLSYFVMASMAK